MQVDNTIRRVLVHAGYLACDPSRSPTRKHKLIIGYYNLKPTQLLQDPSNYPEILAERKFITETS